MSEVQMTTELAALLARLAKGNATASDWPTPFQGVSWVDRAIREGFALMAVDRNGPFLAITPEGRMALHEWYDSDQMKETAKETPTNETPRKEDVQMTKPMQKFLEALREKVAYYSTWNKIAPEHDLWNRAIRLGWVYLKSDGSDLVFTITPEGRAALEKVSPSLRKGDTYDPDPCTCIEDACREAVRRAPCVLHFNSHYLPCEKGMTVTDLISTRDHLRGAAPPPRLADAVFLGNGLMLITNLGNGWNAMPPSWRMGPYANKYDNLAHNGYSLEVVDIVRKTTR